MQLFSPSSKTQDHITNAMQCLNVYLPMNQMKSLKLRKLHDKSALAY